MNAILKTMADAKHQQSVSTCQEATNVNAQKNQQATS